MTLVNRVQIATKHGISKNRMRDICNLHHSFGFPKPKKAPVNTFHLYQEDEVDQWVSKNKELLITKRVRAYKPRAIKPLPFDNKKAISFITSATRKKFKKYGQSTKIKVVKQDIPYTQNAEYDKISSSYDGYYNLNM